MRRVLLSVCLWTLTSVSARAGHAPTIEEWLSLSSVGRPQISPDGRSAVYEEQRTLWKENGYVTQLVIADVQTGRARPLTNGPHSCTGAQWSADGRWIAFLSGGQIQVSSPDGHDAWPLTTAGTAVRAMRWSPDGKRIAFTAAPPSSNAKTREETYGDFQVFERDYAQNQLWVVDFSDVDRHARVAQQLTFDARHNAGAFDWSPDGSTIAFGAWPDPLDDHFGVSQIFAVDVATHLVKPVVTAAGLNWNPHYSPDGKRIAFGTFFGKPHLYASEHVAVVDVATGTVRDLTASFDEDAKILDWTSAGIYFRALQRTASHLFRIDPETGAIQRVSAPASAMLNDISVSHDGRFVAYAAPDAEHLAEVYASSTSVFAPQMLSNSSAQLRGWDTGSMQLVQWKSGGMDVEGVLRLPPAFDATKKYPLIVVIHGGPNGLARPELGFSRYPIQEWLARGALVLEPNYRGSAGYGSAFRAMSVRSVGIAETEDILSGIDALVQRGIVDASRVGAAGWSHGGFVAAFLATHTTRFKAISVGAGISDWRTFYASFPPGALAYLGASPWEDPAIYAKCSPITAVRDAKTPTLIQHGERDSLVPVINAYLLFRGLRDSGVPSVLITYPGFGHGIGRPRPLNAEIQQNYDWFAHYLWGDNIPASSPLHGTTETATDGAQ